MKLGPYQDGRAREPYLPPYAARARLTLNPPLPDGVQAVTDNWGYRHHQYERPDGSWVICGGRRRCRECVREDAMKDTMRRLREALEEHFGIAHMMTVAPDQDLFGDQPAGETGLGGKRDRAEMLVCIEIEFGIYMPDSAAEGVVTLSGLEAIVDATLASGDPDANR